nr:3728_t:CDS:2 [Entrophospora candida]
MNSFNNKIVLFFVIFVILSIYVPISHGQHESSSINLISTTTETSTVVPTLTATVTAPTSTVTASTTVTSPSVTITTTTPGVTPTNAASYVKSNAGVGAICGVAALFAAIL